MFDVRGNVLVVGVVIRYLEQKSTHPATLLPVYHVEQRPASNVQQRENAASGYKRFVSQGRPVAINHVGG